MTKSGPKAAPEIPAPTTIRPHRTPMVSLNTSLKVTVASMFTSDQLRHLASLKDADAPGVRARRQLSDASIEELVEMIVAGRTPTIGWWRRAA